MYYLRQQTRVSGPFTAEQIRGLLHRGRVARSDKVSTDRTTWRTIAETSEIITRPRPVEPVVAEPEVDAAAEIEVETDVAPPDTTMWHYTRGGVQQPAPADTDALRQLVQFGQVRAEDLVWTDGFEGWQPISSVPMFAVHAMPPQGHDPTGRSQAGGEFDGIGNLRPANRKRRKKGWM